MAMAPPLHRPSPNIPPIASSSSSPAPSYSKSNDPYHRRGSSSTSNTNNNNNAANSNSDNINHANNGGSSTSNARARPSITTANSNPTPKQPDTAPSSPASPTAVHPSILQPRVAVVLNVPQPWHPWLFALRLCSILPAVWWGMPSALQLLLRFWPGPEQRGILPPAAEQTVCEIQGHSHPPNEQYALAETALATIWCFASGYLSFFFTDCLMSRWLINYTPQATIVRLLTINAVNAYATLTVLSVAGGFEDARLLLPGWIGIATTLTVCYHITHQKINIRKETSTSINVISIASYISMAILLVHLHSYHIDYPTMPLVAKSRQLWDEASRIVVQIKGSIEHADL